MSNLGAVSKKRDHGGGLDAAVAQYGGTRTDWLDLSTGINPTPYPFGQVPAEAWSALPDSTAQAGLLEAARAFWAVPDGADVLAVPGLSAAIAQIPRLFPRGHVQIPSPTYNEHAAAFCAAGWSIQEDADAVVIVHPNNPTGHYWDIADLHPSIRIIDESFCDVAPARSHINLAAAPNTLVLKSFGKFWGLAGLRLGFVIGPTQLLSSLEEMLGPWPVSGIALSVGRAALMDKAWATTMRSRLAQDAERLDALFTRAGASIDGGTPLFRLYRVDDAARWQAYLARHHIWTRIFPYSNTWLRVGLPDAHGWPRLEALL